MTAASPRSTPPPLAPGLQRQRAGREWGAAAWLSLLAHAALLALLIAHARAVADRVSAAGAGQASRDLQFFTLPAAAPAAVELPPAPAVAPSVVPPVAPIDLDLSAISVAAIPHLGATAARGGGGASAGGPDGATGSGAGTGSGEGGGYIFPPNPRGVIVPPERAPKSVRGRTYRATFWVDAEGRVERVEVSPPIADAEYREALYERLLDFAFYPARTRAGLAVPGVVPILFTIP